jgi:hypothetical protein
VRRARHLDGVASADIHVLQAVALGATSIYLLLPAVMNQTGLQARAALLAAYRAVD